MKELVKGDIAKGAIGYEVKIEDAQLKIAAVVKLEGLIDLASEQVPGDSAVEKLVVELAKSAVKSI